MKSSAQQQSATTEGTLCPNCLITGKLWDQIRGTVTSLEPTKGRTCPHCGKSKILKGNRGDYYITSVVGKGGMGIVFEACPAGPLGGPILNRKSKIVAKVPKLDDLPDFMELFDFAQESPDPSETELDNFGELQFSQTICQSLQDEGDALLALKKAGLSRAHAPIVDVGSVEINLPVDIEFPTVPFTICEYIEARLLSDIVAEYPEGMPAEVVFGVVFNLVLALSTFHRSRIGHGDLAPWNVFVCPDGRIALIDFGLGGAFGFAAKRYMAGSPGFACERQGTGHLDERTDLFMVGAVAAYALCGPVDTERVAACSPGSRDFGHMRWWKEYLRSINVNPYERFPSPLAAQLDMLMTDGGVGSHSQFLRLWLEAGKMAGIRVNSLSVRKVHKL